MYILKFDYDFNWRSCNYIIVWSRYSKICGYVDGYKDIV